MENSELVGKPVFIQTVTLYFTGRLKRTESLGGKHFLVLDKAAWVASTARFHVTMATGELQEVEPYPYEQEVYISFDGVIALTKWDFPLPQQPMPNEDTSPKGISKPSLSTPAAKKAPAKK